MATEGQPVNGTLAKITEASVAAALGRVSRGKVYSLDSRWWRGMPCHPVHPRFDVITYRSPRGEQVQKDQEYLNEPQNKINYGFVSELIMGTAHSGTHIDALCHVTCGEDASWFGDHSSHEHLGDFGALNADAAALGPILARGVLLDVPRALGRPYCPASHPISGAEMQAALDAQGTTIERDDVILIRTGQMQFWPDVEAMALAADSGVGIDGSRWLLERSPLAVGADNVAFECAPSGVDGSSQPVHVHLIREHGIPILEWVNCEELAADGVYEFTFICLPLSVVGATASMVRPIAVV
ncbi:MAG: cyclase family protein [Solirubrobacteraceae bacterium]